MPLTQCVVCSKIEFLSRLPVCTSCARSLRTAPRICKKCLGLQCQVGGCGNPELQIEGFEGTSKFDSVTAAYLSLGPTHVLLRHWKKSPNRNLEDLIFQPAEQVLTSLSRKQIETLVPVPQRSDRSFRLAGGPARRIAERLSRGLERPMQEVLDVDRSHRQAGKTGAMRYETPIEFQWVKNERVPESVLLVDDFMTSGQTLRAACRVLRRSGVVRVHVFILGFRPSLDPQFIA